MEYCPEKGRRKLGGKTLTSVDCGITAHPNARVSQSEAAIRLSENVMGRQAVIGASSQANAKYSATGTTKIRVRGTCGTSWGVLRKRAHIRRAVEPAHDKATDERRGVNRALVLHHGHVHVQASRAQDCDTPLQLSRVPIAWVSSPSMPHTGVIVVEHA